MSSKLFVLMLVVSLGMAIADEFVNEDETKNEEEQRMVMEDMNTQTSTELVQNDDPDSIKNKGLCHWGVAVWYKPGFAIRCSCMKCVCRVGGTWACAYEFAYCPYYYCGNQIYNPLSQLCCCGKVYDKKPNYSCCGYFYYSRLTSQCCNYYSVKPKKAVCPRSKI
ncbi:uncharacterized protein LOC114527629 [Dendronephthya gigantea]|uniref:uncharacterized protein LOC114527629 n=1 Tax=Dendronephthya gigantea TaxID=151771 RepID=UPI00106974FB|nr:uncharacterized protein LOC114527629 [Dendronephthya gigantea]